MGEKVCLVNSTTLVSKEICIRYYHIITVRAQDEVDTANFMFETPTTR